MTHPTPDRLTAALSQTDPALGVFLPAGFPAPGLDLEALQAFAAAGARVLEVGLPYSDPSLDGPAITTAYQHALRHGTRIADVLTTVRRAVATTDSAVVVMTYYNPVYRYGIDRFTRMLADAGAAGAMIPDLPIEAAAPWIAACRAAGLHTPQFVARHTSDTRLAQIAVTASGWLYAPATHGKTGARHDLDLPALEAFTTRLRQTTALPVVTGIGVATPQHAAQVAPFVDGAVIGSPVVRILLDRPDSLGVAEAADHTAAFVESLRTRGLSPLQATAS